MEVKDSYSDDHIAAIFICYKIVNNREQYLNGFERKLGNLDKKIVKFILIEFFDYPVATVSKRKATCSSGFFLGIMKSEIIPENRKLQRIAKELIIMYMVAKKENPISTGLKQELGKQVKALQQLGYPDLTLDRVVQFLLNIMQAAHKRALEVKF